jgi:hypothetical protein
MSLRVQPGISCKPRGSNSPVIGEISGADSTSFLPRKWSWTKSRSAKRLLAERRMELVKALPLLRVMDDVKELARKILVSGLLPATAYRDAVHIALASAYEMDMLLTWKCRHIANARIQQRLRKLAEADEFMLPVICTAEELLEDET